MYSFVPHCTGGKLFPDDGRVVSTALWAGALRMGECGTLAAVTLDHNALGASSVDCAELDLLNVVVSFGALDNLHR